MVILDCPPLLPVVDALDLLPLVNGVLLCVRVMQTTRDEALATKEALARLPERPTALVLTDLNPVLTYGSYYSFYDHR